MRPYQPFPPRRMFFALSLLILIFVHATAKASPTIEITQGLESAMPIAIIPFQGIQAPNESTSDGLADIITADLRRSGQFSPINRHMMPQLPRSESEIQYRVWRKLGVESMLVGSVSRVEPEYHMRGAPEEYRVDFQLIDVFKAALGGASEAYKPVDPHNADIKLIQKDGAWQPEKKQVVLSKHIRFLAKDWRKVAHHISDIVYEHLTGQRGAFSTRILYVNVQRDHLNRAEYRLEMADADGYNPRVLLTSREPLMSPAWSPSGDRIAYVSFEKQRPQIFIQTLSTGKRQSIGAQKGINGAPAWSPDGNHLALVLSKDGNPELYTYDLQTQRFTRITHHRAIDTEPQWTPDGKSLIFTSNRGGKPQIYQYYFDNKRVKRLTFEGDYNARPRMTPDGKTLVVVHRNRGQFHIASLDLRTGAILTLTETTLDESPSIAPNGSMVIYGTTHHGQGVLGAVSIDGRVKLRLPAVYGEVREPAWSPFEH